VPAFPSTCRSARRGSWGHVPRVAKGTWLPRLDRNEMREASQGHTRPVFADCSRSLPPDIGRRASAAAARLPPSFPRGAHSFCSPRPRTRARALSCQGSTSATYVVRHAPSLAAGGAYLMGPATRRASGGQRSAPRPLLARSPARPPPPPRPPAPGRGERARVFIDMPERPSRKLGTLAEDCNSAWLHTSSRIEMRAASKGHTRPVWPTAPARCRPIKAGARAPTLPASPVFSLRRTLFLLAAAPDTHARLVMPGQHECNLFRASCAIACCRRGVSDGPRHSPRVRGAAVGAAAPACALAGAPAATLPPARPRARRTRPRLHRHAGAPVAQAGDTCRGFQ